MVNNIPENIKELMQKLIINKFEAYIVGGAVRDILLDTPPKDYDIFTNATGEQILKIFPKGVVIGNEERQNKILTVIVNGVEISQYRKSGDRTQTGNTLKEHINTCDLTINAIAMNINGEIIDYVNGKDDLTYIYGEDDCRVIKFVGNPQDRINEDLLRILRALRFHAKYEIRIEEKTEEAIIKNISRLKELPIERIREEILKIINSNGIGILLYYKVLNLFIPELTPLLTLDGGKYHNELVYVHCVNSLNNSQQLTNNYLIHLACLFHDIGKQNSERNDDNEITFPKHDIYGSEIVKTIMHRLKFSESEIAYVTTMVKHHMMGNVDKINDRRLIKIVTELEDAKISVEDMLILTYCDMQANSKKERLKFNEFYQQNNWLKRVYKMKYEKQPFRVTDLAIDGHDMIKLGFKGKAIGDILKLIFEIVIDGELKNERGVLLNHVKTICIHTN